MNDYRDMGPSILQTQGSRHAATPTHTGADQSKAAKRGEARLVTQLQPKLINPPAKLTMTLDTRNAKAHFTKRILK